MSKKDISRRDFLYYLGLASAGSFINSSLPIYKSYAAGGQAPLRLLILPKYYGWVTRGDSYEDLATPDANASQGFRLPDYFSSLEPFKQHMIVIENLRGTYWGNAHDHSYANILTNACVQYELKSQQLQYNEPMGPSLDWFLGKQLNKDVLRADFGIGRGAPICFDDHFIRQPMLSTLESIYDEVVKPILDYQNGAGSGELLTRSINQELFKILGRSSDEVERLLQGTGNEQNKLKKFKDSLNAANPNSKIVTSTLASITDPGRTSSSGLDVLELLAQALRLTKAAFMADTKRVGVISFNGNPPLSKLQWTDKDGIAQTGMAKINEEWMAAGNASAPTNFHHLVSHYNRVNPSTGRSMVDANARLCMSASIKLFIDVIADFVSDLSNTIDVDGRPMIENTCIVLTSEISTGTHDTKRKPMILIGGSHAGGLNLGRALKGPVVNASESVINTLNRKGDVIRSGVRGTVGVRTQGDVFVSLARAMGVNINTFGFEPHNTSPFNL